MKKIGILAIAGALLVGSGVQESFSSSLFYSDTFRSHTTEIRKVSQSIDALMSGNQQSNVFFIFGCMGAGKGTEIARLRDHVGAENIVVLKSCLKGANMPPYTFARTSVNNDPQLIPATKVLYIGDINWAIDSNPKASVVIVDETQFLGEKVANDFVELTNRYPNKLFLLYGLKEDFKNEIFPSSQVFIDNKIPTTEIVNSQAKCCSCGSMAKHSSRFFETDHTMLREKAGELFAPSGVDGTTVYAPECTECHNSSAPVSTAAYNGIMQFDRMGRKLSDSIK
jgi:thymidine kinase